MRKFLTLGFIIALLSCKKEENKSGNVVPQDKYVTGLFTANEGNFGGTGSITWYNPDTKAYELDMFAKNNSIPAGEIVQHLFTYNSKMYVTVNGSNKLYIVSLVNGKVIKEIDGLSLPTAAYTADGINLFIIEWVNFGSRGQLRVYNTNTNSFTNTFQLGVFPNAYLAKNNKLYIANTNDNFISIVDVPSKTLETPIILNSDWPNSLQMDASGALWVLCGGKPAWASGGFSPGALVRVNLTDGTKTSYAYGSSFNPSKLALDADGTHFYFMKGDYTGNIARSVLGQLKIDTTDYFAIPGSYAYLLDGSFTWVSKSNGAAGGQVYKIMNSTKARVDSFITGPFPGKIVKP